MQDLTGLLAPIPMFTFFIALRPIASQHHHTRRRLFHRRSHNIQHQFNNPNPPVYTTYDQTGLDRMFFNHRHRHH